MIVIIRHYLGKLNDNQIKNNIVKVKEVNEPNNSPHPISFVFDFFELFILIKSPVIRQEINIKIIRGKLSNSLRATSDKN